MDMKQFRVERTSGGQLYVYERLLGQLERLVAMRQFNRQTRAWE